MYPQDNELRQLLANSTESVGLVELNEFVLLLERRYRQPLFGFLLDFGLAPSECDDVFQHVWLVIVRKLRTNSLDSERLGGLVFTIARNRAFDELRKTSVRRRFSVFMDEEELHSIPAPSLDENLESRFEIFKFHLESILKTVRGISKDVGEVLLLHLREGLTIRDICEKLQRRGKFYTETQIKRAHGYLIKMVRDLVQKTRQNSNDKKTAHQKK